jgi:hypothetical protein
MSAQNMIDLKDYRQPMVTSLGVMLGFLIGFLGQWVTEDSFELKNISDSVAFFGCFFGVLLLLVSLFRMLTPMTDNTKASRFYKSTLWMYIAGVLSAFGGLLLSAFI